MWQRKEIARVPMRLAGVRISSGTHASLKDDCSHQANGHQPIACSVAQVSAEVF